MPATVVVPKFVESLECGSGQAPPLVLDFGCGRDQSAVLNAFCSDQLAGDFVDFARRTPDDDDFQAVVGIEMDVQTRIYSDGGLVLHLG